MKRLCQQFLIVLLLFCLCVALKLSMFSNRGGRLFAGEYLVKVCAVPVPDNCGKTQTCRIICTAANWGRAQWREVFVTIRRKVFVNIGRKVFARIERATA